MSRILHAAARGARIQYRSPAEHKWKANFFLPNCLNDSLYRIHPEDAHLAYGPISTLLREMALTGDCDGADIPYIRTTLLTEEGYWKSTEDQQCVFCLILAEALADEGM